MFSPCIELWCSWEAKCSREPSHMPCSLANKRAFLVLRTASGEFDTIIEAHSRAFGSTLSFGTTALILSTKSANEPLYEHILTYWIADEHHPQWLADRVEAFLRRTMWVDTSMKWGHEKVIRYSLDVLQLQLTLESLLVLPQLPSRLLEAQTWHLRSPRRDHSSGWVQFLHQSRDH